MCYLLVRVAVAGETSRLDTAADLALLAECDQSGVGGLSDGAGRHLGRADLLLHPGHHALDAAACRHNTVLGKGLVYFLGKRLFRPQNAPKSKKRLTSRVDW